MSRQAASALPPAIAALAMSLCTLTGAGTAHAATCQAAPKSPAPQGSHWYYRTDRTLGRKCWYLASEGRKGQAVAPRPAAADEVANAAPAAPPPMAEAAARLTEPLRSPPPPTPPAADWTIAQAAPSTPLPAAPAEPAQSDAAASVATAPPVVTTAAQEPAAEATPAPVIATQPSAPAMAAPERINLTQFVFVAIVGLCLLAGLFPYLAAVRRRREIRIVDLNTKAPLRMPTRESRIASPSLAPADVADRHDEVDIDEERLRRFSQAWKRQAA